MTTPTDPFLGQVAVTVSDRLRVRSEPRVSDDSVMYEPLLPVGTGLRVLDGPVVASGFTWYQVEPLSFRGLESPGFGWVAMADKDGTPWIALADVATITAIAAGNRHTCALTSGGGVKCWGANDRGQLGVGTTRRRLMPVDVVGLDSGVVAIAAGGDTTCALMQRGTVRCWGLNALGQLGDGTTTTIRDEPVEVRGLSGAIRAVSVADLHACALRADGAVLCWGYNQYGELGEGTPIGSHSTSAVVAVPAGDIEAIDAGAWNVCAVSAGGAASCWGGNGTLGGPEQQSSIPVGVTGLATGVRAISAGVTPACALTDSGEVWCWGGNDHGELGSRQTAYAAAPVEVPGLPARAVAMHAGLAHACAVVETGPAYCWGRNSNRELGDGTKAQRTGPVAVRGLPDGALAVNAGDGHTCALLVSGRVRCWGRGDHGQLGDGARSGSGSPVEVDLTVRR